VFVLVHQWENARQRSLSQIPPQGELRFPSRCRAKTTRCRLTKQQKSCSRSEAESAPSRICPEKWELRRAKKAQKERELANEDVWLIFRRQARPRGGYHTIEIGKFHGF
jgi:hypothetical protein